MFEDCEPDHDPLKPYDTIVQVLHLPLSVEVLKIAFPCLPSEQHHSAFKSLPHLLSKRIVTALICSDWRIRILTIPLAPPSPQSKEKKVCDMDAARGRGGCGLFGEQVVAISSASCHQSLPSEISLAFTPRAAKFREDNTSNAPYDIDIAENPSELWSRTASTGTLPSDAVIEVDLLVASHSADLSGLLLVHRISIMRDGIEIDTESAERSVPWQTHYLSSPAVCLEFNPSLHPSPRHTELLVGESKGVIRILNCAAQNQSDSEGLWLMSLSQDFQVFPGSRSHDRRKSLLTSCWCLQGKAILSLFSDGEWGISDINGTGPKAKEGLKTSRRVLGAFVLRGSLSPSIELRNLALGLSHVKKTVNFTPMTLVTNKTQPEKLFIGSTTQPRENGCGGVCISPTFDACSTSGEDESILLWYSRNIFLLPSLNTHWQSKARGTGNLFGTGTRGQLRLINTYRPTGENLKSISMFPDRHPLETKSNERDVLITGARSIIILASPYADNQVQNSSHDSMLNLPNSQSLLAQGKLDVNDLDRMLGEMSNRLASSVK